jgi:hypothetical protein
MNLISILAIVIAGLFLTSCSSTAGHATGQVYQKSRQDTPKTTPTQAQRAYAADAAASVQHLSSSLVQSPSEGDAGATHASQAAVPAPPPSSSVAETSYEGEARATYAPQTAVSATPQPSSVPTRPSKAGTHFTQSTQVEKVIGSKPVIGDDSELRN